jgi:ammonia channel protein AmtB
VHGYAGFFGVVIAGFVLWGYPSSPTEGYAAVNPLGQFVGALIMFGLLGFLPGWITALILQGFGVLRIPREIEIQGLDFARMEDSDQGDKDLAKAERAEA